MNYKFKEGDRVRIVSIDDLDKGEGIKVGMTATVLEECSAPYCRIDGFKDPTYAEDGYALTQDQLELIPKRKHIATKTTESGTTKKTLAKFFNKGFVNTYELAEKQDVDAMLPLAAYSAGFAIGLEASGYGTHDEIDELVKGLSVKEIMSLATSQS